MVKDMTSSSGHANFIVGCSYEAGQGVNQDLSKSLKFFKKALKMDHTEAHVKVAAFHLNAVTIERDVETGVKLLRVAADRGSIEGLINLGVCHASGLGMDEDLVESYLHFQQAAQRSEHPRAHFLCAVALQFGHGANSDPVKAMEHLKNSVDQNFPPAVVHLGRCYMDGQLGLPQDVPLAIRHFEKGVEMDEPLGRTMLGICFKDGLGVPQDMEKAEKLLQAAAMQGDQLAKTFFADVEKSEVLKDGTTTHHSIEELDQIIEDGGTSLETATIPGPFK
eukprot:Plantae.Rhodophyta-Palmaria_palmata.ctg12513.p1 GENE.Plantae.Rhodophyta-Palmaria_palmata.ctg12513~~Plantae.Rhodophyta-Palmaria_palmata.ctg12513.p1  ORF type:complete len:296 (-),score=51.39 Plantae.Rhodophyta-Palmaria_palmata.ctg12513:17-850(-)